MAEHLHVLSSDNSRRFCDRMSESFHSARFAKRVSLTNHAIEAMAKRHVTLAEVKILIEQGSIREKGHGHAWISHHFPARGDNLVCAAVVVGDTLIVKTIMVDWQQRQP
jgi:hypothetical protein